MVNSGHSYGGICLACAMFSGDRGRQDILVTMSFTYGTKTTYMSLMGMPRNYPEYQGEGKQITNNRHIPSCRPYDHYCCALRDDDESVIGDVNRGNFLVMLKLTAKMQHTVKPLYSEHSRDPNKCSLYGGVHPRGVRYVHAHMYLKYNVHILKLFCPCLKGLIRRQSHFPRVFFLFIFYDLFFIQVYSSCMYFS